MLKTLVGAFKNKDIRKKILYTLMILVIVRVGSLLPIPGVDTEYFSSLLSGINTGDLSYLSAFTGGSFERMSLFALSITPYITSSIIMQLLAIAIPKLEEMQKEGEDGRKKIAAITRYVTIALALIESIAMAVGFGRSGLIKGYQGFSTLHYIVSIIVVVAALTAGSAMLMWLGERITENGVGNGISIVLLINIISGMPSDFATLYSTFVAPRTIAKGVLAAAIIIAILVVMVVLVCFLQDGERRIPVQYSQKVSGRKTFGGQSTNIPLKVNTAGVMPVIFASSLMQFPVIIAQLFGKSYEWTRYLSSSYWCRISAPKYSIGLILYIVLLIVEPSYSVIPVKEYMSPFSSLIYRLETSATKSFILFSGVNINSRHKYDVPFLLDVFILSNCTDHASYSGIAKKIFLINSIDITICHLRYCTFYTFFAITFIHAKEFLFSNRTSSVFHISISITSRTFNNNDFIDSCL